MRADKSARALIFVFGFALLAACTSQPKDRQQATAAPKSAELDVGKPMPAAAGGTPVAGIDLRGSVERAQLAYRASADGHESFAPTYAVRERAGLVSVTPLHFPSAATESDSARRTKSNVAKTERWEGSPFTIETLKVERRDNQTALRAPTSSVGAAGELLVDRGSVTEVFENERAGVQQSWRFSERPEGRGDLLVQVAVRGQEFREATATGLHFSGKNHGLGMRYGHATWIDARGRETAIPARWSHGVIELRVDEGVMDAAAYPAVLDPVIGPELATDEPVTTDNVRDAPRSDVASSPSGLSLIVWSVNQDIYGTRVDSSGTILDPGGFAISDSRALQDFPSVGFDGTNFLVVWSDFRNNAQADVYGARVSTGGIVQDPDGIPISTGPLPETAPVVSDRGSGRSLVAWEDNRGLSFDIYGARVSAGLVEDAAGILISAALNSQSEPDIAYDGNANTWLVVWTDDRSAQDDIYGANVDSTGVVLDALGVAITDDPSSQSTPTVTSLEGPCFVAWADYRNGNSDIYAQMLVGSTLDLDNFPVTVASGDQTAPVAAFGQFNVLSAIAWNDRRNLEDDIYSNRFNAGGEVSNFGSDTLLDDGPTSAFPALAWDGTNYVYAWREGAPANQNIFMSRVAPSATRLDPDVLVSEAANAQQTPDAAFDGTNWLVVWSDTRNDAGDIYGARFSATGALLDAAGIAISEQTGAQVEPRIDYDGDNYLVVWSDGRSGSGFDLYGTVVASNGNVIAPAGTLLSSRNTNQTMPDVAHDGTNWLVVWEDTFGGTIVGDVFAARVSPAGTVVDTTAIPVSEGVQAEVRPRVAFNGTDWLVVWEDLRSSTSTDIYGARISSAGIVRDPAGIAISTGIMITEQYPALASNGMDVTLVVWGDFRNGNGDVYGARVGSDASVVPAIPIAVGALSQNNPAVSYDGENWLVAWSDGRQGTGASDLFLTEVSATGVVASPEVSVSAARYLESNVALAAGTAGNTLVAYQTTSGENIRVKARVSSPLCMPNALSDITCDGVDDDCSGTADEDYAPVVTTCGSGGCATTGMTSCALAVVSDSCAPDPTDTDEDGVPDCRDECPTVGSTTSTGCRPRPNPTAEAGSGGADDGIAGASTTRGGTTASGGRNGSTGGVGGESDGGDNGSNQAGETSANGGSPSTGDGGQSGDGTGGRLSEGGSGGDSDDVVPSAPPLRDDDDGGCGCRVGSSRTATHGAWMFAAAALVLGLRRRQR